LQKLTREKLNLGINVLGGVACVAGRRKGGKGSKRPWEYWKERRRERPARTLLFSCFFFVHQTNVKIMIGQIL